MGYTELDYYQWTGIYEQSTQRESKGNSERQINSHVFCTEVRHLRVPSCILLHLLAALLRGSCLTVWVECLQS